MPFTAGQVSQFPEKPRSSHGPEGGEPKYHKSSSTVGAGHTQHGGRMPHPFSQETPNSESGEGKNKG
jgi:hypothetical protein